MAEDHAGRQSLVRRSSLKSQVEHWLRSRILRGDYPPGTFITCAAIIKAIRQDSGEKCSRTPTGEAMDRLIVDGILSAKTNMGAVVNVIGTEGLFDSLTLRYAIETQAAQRLGRSAHSANVARLREAHAAIVKFRNRSASSLVEGPTSRWTEANWQLFELDRRFHLTLAELSGIRRAQAYVDNQMDLFLLYASVHAGSFGDPTEEHEAIVRAIESYGSRRKQRADEATRAAVKEHMVLTAGRWATLIVPGLRDLD